MAPHAVDRTCPKRRMSGRDGAGLSAISSSPRPIRSIFSATRQTLPSASASRVWRSERARAALLKGCSLFALGLWVAGTTALHAYDGTLPKAEVMGIVGLIALLTNGAVSPSCSIGLAVGMRICVRRGYALVMMQSAISPSFLPRRAFFGTGSGWPDVIVAAIMAALAAVGRLAGHPSFIVRASRPSTDAAATHRAQSLIAPQRLALKTLSWFPQRH